MYLPRFVLAFVSMSAVAAGAACNDAATTSGDVVVADTKADTGGGDTTAAETAVHETTVAETTVHETTVDETTVHETVDHEMVDHETMDSDTMVHETMDSDTMAHDTTVHETTPSDTTVSETSETTETTQTCTRSGFTAVAQDAMDYSPDISYIAQTSTGAPVDTLTIDTYSDFSGASGPGTYALKAENFADCGNCVLAHAGCDENLSNCTKLFYAQGGTLEITTWGAAGEHFTGTLTGAVLYEATIDENDVSTLVPGGETWCIDSFAFDAVIQ